MARVKGITGVKEVLANLRKADYVFGKGIERGLKRAGLWLQGLSQQFVPVDTGNLKNSAFTRASGKGMKTDVFVGYTAAYAVYVHEMLDNKHKMGKIAKFLELPMRSNRENLLKIIGGGGKLKW
jgi:hypothetical protein